MSFLWGRQYKDLSFVLQLSPPGVVDVCILPRQQNNGANCAQRVLPSENGSSAGGLPSRQRDRVDSVMAVVYCCFCVVTVPVPRSGELRTQKLKFKLVRTQLKRSPFKPGVGQYIAMHATLTARYLFLPRLFLPFWSIHLHSFQNLSRFFLCWLWLTHGVCVGPQNKLSHPAGCRFPC